MKVDVLYTSWNRLEYVTATWGWLMAHTDWSRVNKLVVYDDGSEDGTLEFLREQIEWARDDHIRDVELRLGDFRSPPAVMNHYLATSEADMFAKVDSDIALPGGWLEALLSAMPFRGKLDLLGMEAGMIELSGRDGKEWNGRYTWESCSHIGGVGLMRVDAFRKRPPIPSRMASRFGFTEWQDRYGLRRAWIKPDILCPQLDRIPLEPWMSLAETYISEGWSRPWGRYDARWMEPYWSWMLPAEVEA